MKVISGGQTGVDQGGLFGARDAGVETGGTAPLGYLTEDGENFGLKNFGLVESSSRKYPPRTEKNVVDSDGTLIIGKVSPGSLLTKKLCIKHNKPFLWLDPDVLSVEEAVTFIRENNINTLNVAGNREKNSPGIFLLTRNFIREVIVAIPDEETN